MLLAYVIGGDDFRTSIVDMQPFGNTSEQSLQGGVINLKGNECELMHQTIRTFWFADDEEPDYDDVGNLSYHDGKDLKHELQVQGDHISLKELKKSSKLIGSQEDKLSEFLRIF